MNSIETNMFIYHFDMIPKLKNAFFDRQTTIASKLDMFRYGVSTFSLIYCNTDCLYVVSGLDENSSEINQQRQMQKLTKSYMITYEPFKL